MKKNRIYAGFLVAAATLMSCNESLPEHFGAIEGIYLNNTQTNKTHVDETALTFVYEDGDRIKVPVKVQLTGRISTQQRPVAIRVSSENAELGTDYELTTDAILPADATSFDYVVTLRRTEALKTQVKSLVVEIQPNEHFIIPFTQLVAADGTQTSVTNYRIDFSDQFTAPPTGWDADFVGPFTYPKFELLCKVLEMPRSDFNEPGKISSAKWIYMQTTIMNYVQDQVDLKAAGKPFDPNAFDEKGLPLRFSNKS